MPNAPGKNGTWEVEEVEYYFEESSAAEWLRKKGNGDGVVGVSLDPPAPPIKYLNPPPVMNS